MSTFKSLTKRASRFLRRDEAEEQSLGSMFDMTRKWSKKRAPVPQFDILNESSMLELIPQLPELTELSKTNRLKKAKSLAVMSSQPHAEDLADAAPESFRNYSSMEVARPRLINIKVPGAFPSSSSGSRPSPVAQHQNGSTETIVRAKPDMDDRTSSIVALNESTDTIIRHAQDSELSTPVYLQTGNRIPTSATNESAWTTTTEDSFKLGVSVSPCEADIRKSKHKIKLGPWGAVQNFRGMTASASTTSSIRELPPHKHLRHQPKLPSGRRWASEESEIPDANKVASRQASQQSKFHLPSAVSRSKLRWGDLSSNFSSTGSGNLANLRKDLRLPSRRISTPDLTYLLRAEEFAKGLSERLGTGEVNKSFFDDSSLLEEGFDQEDHQNLPSDEHEHQEDRPERRANKSFFGPAQEAPIPHQSQAIINNLYEAVKRVDVEMARVQLENRQLLRAEEEANSRAAFWEERIGDIENAIAERQAEKEELTKLLLDNGVEIPEHLLGSWDGEAVEGAADAQDGEDSGYDGDVSNATQCKGEVENAAGKQRHAGSGRGI